MLIISRGVLFFKSCWWFPSNIYYLYARSRPPFLLSPVAAFAGPMNATLCIWPFISILMKFCFEKYSSFLISRPPSYQQFTFLLTFCSLSTERADSDSIFAASTPYSTLIFAILSLISIWFSQCSLKSFYAFTKYFSPVFNSFLHNNPQDLYTVIWTIWAYWQFTPF